MEKIVVPARDIVVASRVPSFPEGHSNPFTHEEDVMAMCDCGWRCYGEASEVKLAIQDHQRRFHPEEQVAFALNEQIDFRGGL